MKITCFLLGWTWAWASLPEKWQKHALVLPPVSLHTWEDFGKRHGQEKKVGRMGWDRRNMDCMLHCLPVPSYLVAFLLYMPYIPVPTVPPSYCSVGDRNRLELLKRSLLQTFPCLPGHCTFTTTMRLPARRAHAIARHHAPLSAFSSPPFLCHLPATASTSFLLGDGGKFSPGTFTHISTNETDRTGTVVDRTFPCFLCACMARAQQLAATAPSPSSWREGWGLWKFPGCGDLLPLLACLYLPTHLPSPEHGDSMGGDLTSLPFSYSFTGSLYCPSSCPPVQDPLTPSSHLTSHLTCAGEREEGRLAWAGWLLFLPGWHLSPAPYLCHSHIFFPSLLLGPLWHPLPTPTYAFPSPNLPYTTATTAFPSLFFPPPKNKEGMAGPLLGH